MLVKFESEAGSITTFGEVARELVRMMGYSGDVPGALRPEDIPAALERLKHAVAADPGRPLDPERKEDPQQPAPKVALHQRAYPLIRLLEAAARRGSHVTWQEHRPAAGVML